MAERRPPWIEIFQGLPASGKTTMARTRVEAAKGTVVRVCKDDLRDMLHNGRYDPFAEELVLAVRDAAIVAAVRAGFNVVVDDTNIDPRHIVRIRSLVDDDTATVMVTVFDTPLEECIARNYARGGKVPEARIRQMARQWEAFRADED